MTLLLILLLCAAYLGGLAAQIAIAGHFHGKVEHSLEQRRKASHDGYLARSTRRPYEVKMNWLVAAACLSPVWPACAVLVAVASLVGGVGWLVLHGGHDLFSSQSQRATRVEERRVEMKKLEKTQAIGMEKS